MVPAVGVLIRSTGLGGRGVRTAAVRARAEAMLRALRLEEAELSVLLCDDATIQELNREWRRKNRPTDVLAFPLIDHGAPSPSEAPSPPRRPRVRGGSPRPRALGDIVISVDTARRQAAEDDRPILGRVVFLLAHGLLHLLGYDHGTRPEERRMTAMTDVLVSAAGKPEGLGKKAGENPRGGVSGGAETRARGGRRRIKK